MEFLMNIKQLTEELSRVLNEKDYIRVFDVGHPNSRCVALMRGDEEIDNFGTGWKKPQSEEQIRKEARRFFKGLPKDIEVIIEDE